MHIPGTEGQDRESYSDTQDRQSYIVDDELMLEDEPASKAHFWTVAVYLCDRSYGGPEEGGWWYDTGTRVDEPMTFAGLLVPQIFASQDAAYSFAQLVQSGLDSGLNADDRNRDLSSVNCIGRYMAEVHAGYPPEHYPELRPHYE